MATMLDYLAWRGDLTFDQAPFNEVDNLLLSQLSYLELAGVVPAPGEGRGVSMATAWRRFRELHQDDPATMAPGGVVSPQTPLVFEALAAAARFSHATLSRYVTRLEQLDEDAEQFAALCVRLDDGSTYVAFRGTDATFAGWREDFAMSFSEVPAQRSAVAYLDEVRRRVRGPLRVGGHSKGGNLAVYAAAKSGWATRRRIVEVWSNDGPGFCEDLLPQSSFDAISDRVHHIVPEFCVIGQLLNQPCEHEVIEAEGMGVMQHDAMGWQVMGPGFVRATGMAEGSRRFGELFNETIAGKDLAWRRGLTDALFDALEAGGASIDELQEGGTAAYLRVTQAYLQVNPEYREAVETITGSLVGEAALQGLAEAGRGLAEAGRGLAQALKELARG